MAVIDRHYDEGYVRELLVRLARVPTDVPLGAFEIDPTDPKIRHFVHDVVVPEIDRIGFWDPSRSTSSTTWCSESARARRRRPYCSWPTPWRSTGTTRRRSSRAAS
jgi:hypothetical protein